MASNDANGSHAAHACQTCRRQKRRCTKELPRCLLCTRFSRECIYTDPSLPPRDDYQALHARIAELEAVLSRQQSLLGHTVPDSGVLQPCTTSASSTNTKPLRQFPAVFFLDFEVFEEARMTIANPGVPIPDDIYQILEGVNGLRKIASIYFYSTHIWFPILCRKRFEIMLDDDDLIPSPDLAVLFATMFLLHDEDSNCGASTTTSTYWSIKHFASVLEDSSFITPQLLQANVLLTLYELGHAIYPAAYLSLGKCAAMAKALGLDDREKAPQMTRRYGTWAKLEEMRRVWWAVVLLDRFVHLSFPGHALAVEDVPGHEVLPADDHQFDIAEMVGSEPLYMTSPTNLPAGPFTRACQAANLIGKVVDVLNELRRGIETRFISAIQIFHTLTAFSKVVKSEFEMSPERYATPMALTYSAMISLCDPFCCTNSNRGSNTLEETKLQALCISGIKTISDDILQFANTLRPSMIANTRAISPLIGHCLYMATITFSWREFENERDEALKSYQAARSVLVQLNDRWAVGGEYISAVDKARELLYNMRD